MCRLAAYLGPAIPLQQFLLAPPHSLYRQAWEPQELKYARFNADGFGFGWYSPDGTPSTYTSALPIWSDNNLPDLAHTLTAPLWLAEVRSATEGHPVHQFNTAPFCDSRRLFTHNGFIRDFHHCVQPAITAMLTPEIASGIRGNTDSEYLFACLQQLLLNDATLDLPQAIRRLFSLLADMITNQAALLNIVITDSVNLYAARHGINHDCPSLYYATADKLFPGGQVIASERFSNDSSWQAVPEHHLLIAAPGEPPRLLPL